MSIASRSPRQATKHQPVRAEVKGPNVPPIDMPVAATRFADEPKESRPRAFRLERAVCGPEVSAGRSSGPGAGGLLTHMLKAGRVRDPDSRDRKASSNLRQALSCVAAGFLKGPAGNHTRGGPPLLKAPLLSHQTPPTPQLEHQQDTPDPRTNDPTKPPTPEHLRERIGQTRTGAVFPESVRSERTRPNPIPCLSSPPAGH